MGGNDHLVLFGASVRAAAFSAARAGLQPWCADLFADTDLQALCPALAIPPTEYPRALSRIATDAPGGPWMYTGALENHPGVVQALSERRPLWGNDAHVLRRARSPVDVARCLREAGLAHPPIITDPGKVPRTGRWLAKPLRGAGGRGIDWVARGNARPAHRGVYFQEYVEGEPCAAVYVGDGAGALLLGATRQLVGESWLHAAPFHYGGSVGPLSLSPRTLSEFRRLGDVLAAGLGLRGLFGVDCVLRDESPRPVEVNPRYPASVEVLEYASGVPALALHRRVFDPGAPAPPAALPGSRPAVVGKAVLFAREPLGFPREGPWRRAEGCPPAVNLLPLFADVPPAGQPIGRGRPVLTFFAAGGSAEECLGRLRATAADLDHRLFGR
jgi:predicted ATP-grasp superfamily ATP-dependent carboligase